MNKNLSNLFKIFFLLLLTACLFNINNILSKENIITANHDGENYHKAYSDIKFTSYKIIKEKYCDKDIIINFPQIIYLNDLQKEKNINLLIKNEAMNVLNTYDQESSNLYLNIEYTIKLKSDNVLSIVYYGEGYVINGAYPNNIYYTANIDIKREVKIKFKKIIIIDDYLIEKFKRGKYMKFDSKLNVEVESRNVLNKFTTSELVEYLNQIDYMDFENELSAFYYLTKDSIGISIGVPHAIGDHAEFEIKYKDLKNKLKTDNGIISSIYKAVE